MIVPRYVGGTRVPRYARWPNYDAPASVRGRTCVRITMVYEDASSIVIRAASLRWSTIEFLRATGRRMHRVALRERDASPRGASLTEQLPRSIVEKIPRRIPLIGCTVHLSCVSHDRKWCALKCRTIESLEWVLAYAYLSAQLYRTNA